MKTQRETLQWAVDTFGPCARDRRERAMRFLEEALELAQAEGLEVRDVDRLMWRVFERPPGETEQEIAGVHITLASLSERAGIQISEAVEAEWRRIESKPPEYFQHKHADKVAEGVAAANSVGN